MKKIVLMVCVLLILFGCSNNEAYKDDEIYQYAEEIAVDYIFERFTETYLTSEAIHTANEIQKIKKSILLLQFFYS